MESPLDKIKRYDINPTLQVKHDWKYGSEGRTSKWIPEIILEEEEDAFDRWVLWSEIADFINSQQDEIERLNELLAKKIYNQVP